MHLSLSKITSPFARVIFACLAEWLMLPAEGIVWVPFHISNALKLLQHL